MSFDNIPHEMRAYKSWVLWRLEFRPPMAKPTKPLYIAAPGGHKANVMDATTWRTFDEALAAPLTCTGAVDPSRPISETGFSGIGFVFSQADPYSGIDLDDTHGDQEAYDRQQAIFRDANSYTELSPSGQGVHIIVKGTVPTGKRRACIEVYSEGRYFTMTGNAIHNVEIADRQPLLDILYRELGGDKPDYLVQELTEEAITDEALKELAAGAVNGELFSKLWSGDWQNTYHSQSEADIALYNIIAFYSKHRLQSRRIFRQSALGQRDKASRDKYLDYMFEKSFDNQLPPVDTANFKRLIDEMLAGEGATASQVAEGATEPGRPSEPMELNGHTAAPATHNATSAILTPSGPVVNGLLNRITEFFYQAAPRPVWEIAEAGAIAYLSGIAGRSFNVSKTGLNQYSLLAAPTGSGKDAVASGVAKLNTAISKTCPSIIDFKGPGELVSSAGLIKWLAMHPCCFTILGEFGKKLREMAAPNANAHLTSLSRVILQLYSKSGNGQVFDPMAYSDREKNTAPLLSPSLTIFAETTPEGFYDYLDEGMISDGLLPRFMVTEYKGDRPKFNESSVLATPDLGLVQDVVNLVASSLALNNQGLAHDIGFQPAAWEKFREFDHYTTDLINQASGESQKQLWNRAHLKAMKLAGVRALSDNSYQPEITLEHCLWATDEIMGQTNRLLAKFEVGEIGQAGASENRQLAEVVKVISMYIREPFEKFQKYNGANKDMHAHGVIAEALIQNRVVSLACFRHDKRGANDALKRTMKILVDADELREMPRAQMLEKYGKGPRSYVIADAARFAKRG